MMTDASGRFALPWLQPGQAQKEAAYNEALAIVDAALHLAVQAVGVTVPPASPAIGQCWIVGAAPTGAWAGKSDAVAAWTEGGWRFIAPVAGLRAWSIADGLDTRWTGAGWMLGTVDAAMLRIGGLKVIGARGAAIPAPAGGGTIDVQARAAIGALIATLAGHGLIAT